MDDSARGARREPKAAAEERRRSAFEREARALKAELLRQVEQGLDSPELREVLTRRLGEAADRALRQVEPPAWDADLDRLAREIPALRQELRQTREDQRDLRRQLAEAGATEPRAREDEVGDPSPAAEGPAAASSTAMWIVAGVLIVLAFVVGFYLGSRLGRGTTDAIPAAPSTAESATIAIYPAALYPAALYGAPPELGKGPAADG